ncbi:imelysin family protein [Poseidonibacter antarcticus]|uniref:imelysin family protein n=1 Tax=Poseidonibacter antarcticus TaxID=2478538 RepID=UPI000EF53393|nr:imelysin family protein [Poseidonibacter antarcticus]
MKKILFMMMILVSTVFADQTALNSILKNISIPNVDKTIKNANVLKENLNEQNFKKFLSSWKKVEALYFAGEIDNDYLDTPRYIDVFHNLKEDLKEQMQRVIASKDEPNIALFKNSFKTINALEYVLFNDDKITKREKLLSLAILDSIVSHLNDIKGVYTQYLSSKPKSETWENAMIINSLIASTYRLKEWRIGDPSGNSSKYKDNADNKRAEYFLSKSSFLAIKSILDAHEEIMGESKYLNFGKMAVQSGAKAEVAEVENAIHNSLNELKKLKNDDFSNAKDLYEDVKSLHNAYYLSLIEQLAITAKILDADGD